MSNKPNVCRALFYASFLILLLLSQEALAGERTDREPEQVNKIYARIKSLIIEFYPKAEVSSNEVRFSAKFDTRTFMIHHPYKTGEWQEARAQEGPNRHGMICSIDLKEGRWQGAAVLPQTFNNRYFQTSLQAPFNSKLNKHLLSHLDYPDGTPPRFLQEFNSIVNSFAD